MGFKKEEIPVKEKKSEEHYVSFEKSREQEENKNRPESQYVSLGSKLEIKNCQYGLMRENLVRDLLYKTSQSYLDNIASNYAENIISVHRKLCQSLLQKPNGYKGDSLELMYATYLYLKMYTESKALVANLEKALNAIFYSYNLQYTTTQIDTPEGAVKRLTWYKNLQVHEDNKNEKIETPVDVAFSITENIRECAEQDKRSLIAKESYKTVVNKSTLFSRVDQLKSTASSHLRSSNKNYGIFRFLNFLTSLFQSHKNLVREIEKVTTTKDNKEDVVKLGENTIKSDVFLHAVHIYLKDCTNDADKPDNKELLAGIENILKAKYGEEGLPSNTENLVSKLNYAKEEDLKADLLKGLEWCAKQDGKKDLTLNNDFGIAGSINRFRIDNAYKNARALKEKIVIEEKIDDYKYQTFGQIKKREEEEAEPKSQYVSFGFGGGD